MKIKTSELQGAALDWAVAKCEGVAVTTLYDEIGSRWYVEGKGVLLDYSTDWAQGGPIIEREKINLFPDDPVSPKACLTPNQAEPHYFFRHYGSTPLIAAMRCYVASKLGDEVDIPEELIQERI